jgi:hypothetical protein
VKAKYMISSGCRDDLFDWQIGFTGAVQHGLAYQNASIASGGGREGFEADNSEFGADDLPRSNPRFCNMTVIGCSQQGCNSTGNGARLRRGTAGKIQNAIFMDWPNGGVQLDGTCDKALATPNGVCSTLKTTEPILRLADTIFYNVGPDNVGADGVGDLQVNASSACATSCGPNDVYDAWVGGAGVLPTRNTNGTNPLPGVDGVYPTNATLAAESATFFPANGGIADDAPDCSVIDPFFDSATYVGGFDPNGSAAVENDANNWLRPTSSGWVSFAVN